MFIYTMGDIVGTIFLGIMLIILAVTSLNRAVKQYLCKHERYWENGSCDAICYKCGKNLGFIGSVNSERKKNI